MVVMFLLTPIRNLSIAIYSNRNTGYINRRVIGGQFRDDIAKYHSNNSVHSYENIINYPKDIKYSKSNIKESNEKSLRQDMFKELNRLKVSYPPAEHHFFKSMLSKDLCNQYTLECIYVSFFSFKFTGNC